MSGKTFGGGDGLREELMAWDMQRLEFCLCNRTILALLICVEGLED